MKSLIMAAIIAIMLPSYASAGLLDFGLGILKAAGLIVPKVISAFDDKPADKPAADKPAAKAAAAPAKPTPEEITDAVNELVAACAVIAREGLPCAPGSFIATRYGIALDAAMADAEAKLARAIENSVTVNIDLAKEATDTGDDDDLKSSQEFKMAVQSVAKTKVKGAQIFMKPHTQRRKNDKNKDVFEVTVIMVLNPDLVGKALEAHDKNEPVEKSLIEKSLLALNVLNDIGSEYKKSKKKK
jgi:hypothetical protein